MSVTIGVTGPQGFIAQHLVRALQAQQLAVITADKVTFADPARLATFVRQCDVIVHLAGANRGPDAEVYQRNITLTGQVVSALEAADNHPHVVFASSTQRDADNAYGKSKLHCEQALQKWAATSRGKLTTLVIPNVYGPGCKPFYNSVVATFCHQLATGEQPEVLCDATIQFLWVNQLVHEIVEIVKAEPPGLTTRVVPPTAELKVSDLLALLRQFHHAFFVTGLVPDISDPLRASLYATFLYYVSLDQHTHEPQVFEDQRGQLFEIIKLANGGQVFCSSTRPGVIRGNHYHTRKVEWFCVLRGEATIRLRHVGHAEVKEFRVSGHKPQFISIPVMHAHSIENTGDDELLTMFWCNEIFDPQNTDTIYEQVL